MVTLIKYGASCNELVLFLEGLSTDTKPIEFFDVYDNNGTFITKKVIENGSKYTEIDTGKEFAYDAENETWYEDSSGGGGIKLVGETTTALTDEATTNPIIVDGQSYTAQPNDAVIYGSKEFLFDGTKWHEFGDLSGLASKDIGAMTGYAKASTGSAIATTDTLNQAIGKVEKRVEVNENNILSAYGGTIGKNILNTKITLGLPSGLTATLNDDKSITVNGTSLNVEPTIPFVLGGFTPIVGKTYVCKGTGNANIRINIFDGDSIVCASSDDATFTAQAGKSYIASVWVAGKPESGTQFNNVTIYPMICEQSIYTADSSYQPYILSNREASDTIQAIQQTIGDINTVLEEVL